MLPKEHGAYGQMALPLATAMAAAGASASSLLLSAAVVAGFLAHEPLLVLLGRRGSRARRESSRRARRWLATTAMTAAGTGVLGAWSMPAGARWSLALPLLPATVLSATIAAGREKGVAAEVAVAAAFSLVAVPVSLAAGARVEDGAAIAAVFAGIFVTATLSVRGIIATTRGGGNVETARRFTIATILLAGVAVAGLAWAATRGLMPWAGLAAGVPGLGLAAALALVPPPPSRLRAVGWTLVAVSVAAGVTLAIGLPATP